MNHIDKSESFDPEALRRKASEIRTIASGATSPDHDGGKTVELNPLAQKIALQFRADTYSPSMIADAMKLTAEARVKGTAMAKTTIIPSILITKDNAAKYYFPDSPY